MKSRAVPKITVTSRLIDRPPQFTVLAMPLSNWSISKQKMEINCSFFFLPFRILESYCCSQSRCAVDSTAVMAATAACRAILSGLSDTWSQTTAETTVGAQRLRKPAAQISAALSNCDPKHLRSHFKTAGLPFFLENLLFKARPRVFSDCLRSGSVGLFECSGRFKKQKTKDYKTKKEKNTLLRGTPARTKALFKRAPFTSAVSNIMSPYLQ